MIQSTRRPARSLSLIAALAAALACAAPAPAQQPPAPAAADPDVGAFVCDLTGDCGDQPTAVAAPHGGARASATRGFTFKRTAPDPKAGAALAAGTATTPAPAGAPARLRSADLRLDFASASAGLNPAARTRLSKLAVALGNPRLATHRVRIEGHTDASGNPVANRALSQRRAQAAADYLVSAGVARERIEVIGYGSAQPLPGMLASAPENRRVMATLLN